MNIKPKAKRRINKKLIAITLIIIVALLVGGYFGYNYYKKYQDNKAIQVFNNGINYAGSKIIELGDNCQVITLSLNEVSKQYIDITCIKPAVEAPAIIETPTPIE